jgi:hypothetical protein
MKTAPFSDSPGYFGAGRIAPLDPHASAALAVILLKIASTVKMA